jgi:hypothetical protein
MALWYTWWQGDTIIQLQPTSAISDGGDAPPNPDITHHSVDVEVHHSNPEARIKHRIPDVPNSPPERRGEGGRGSREGAVKDQSGILMNLMNTGCIPGTIT